MESSSVFFPGEISLFIDKEIGNFLEEFFFKNLVQIQLIFLFFGLNFAEFFQHEKNEKIKHWKAGFLLRIL
jgi:hypothetical protein